MNSRNALLIIVAILLGASTWYISRKNTTPQRTNDTTIIVGTNAEYQPYSFIQDDVIVGFDIDIITQAIERMGKTMELKNMSFDALIPEIQLGSIHVIAAGISPSTERAQQVLFTKPHITGDPLLIISPKNKPLMQTIDDLDGKVVAVNQGYTADSYASTLPNVTLMRLSSALVSDGLLALRSGHADAFIAAQNSLEPYRAQYGSDEFNYVALQDTAEQYAFAVCKKYPELFAELEKTLAAMQEDGTIAALKTKWGLS